MSMSKKPFITYCTLILMIVAPVLASGQFSYHLPLIKQEKTVKDLLQFNDTTKHKNKNTDGLYFGINFGSYFANRYTAQYYNGSGVNKLNDSLLHSLYNYQNIKTALAADSFWLGELPTKMKYNPAFLIGIYFKYNIKNSGIFVQFNFSKLKASDAFTIMVFDPNNPSKPIPKIESITGSEKRASIDIGYSYMFSPHSNYRPFIQFGGNMTNTKFIENKIKIENLEYSIANYHYAYYKIEQGGIGFGAFAGGGMNLIFNESVSIMPTLNIYYTQAKMGNNIQARFNYTFYITAILNGIL